MRGLQGIKTYRDIEVKGKSVFLRLDLNVPIKNGEIQDETRIQGALPTIKELLQREAKLVLASHLGRPKGEGFEEKYSMEPVAHRLSELLDKEVILIEEPNSEAPGSLLKTLRPNQLLLLENLRFDKGETKNSPALAQTWASYTDVYINDAFGACHRAHASISALAETVPERGIGELIEKEVAVLEKLLSASDKPYVAILGGAKVSDKIGVIEHLLDRVDALVIGGGMAYTFLASQGVAIGKSLVEEDKIRVAGDLIKRMEARNKAMILPQDHVIATSIDATDGQTTPGPSIPEAFLGVDIGPRTRTEIGRLLEDAKVVFWNGPMGVFENPAFAAGTFSVAENLAKSSAYSVVGGGDSAAAAEKSGFADKMSHISTGGGASLEYLQGDPLPGLEVLRAKRTSEQNVEPQKL